MGSRCWQHMATLPLPCPQTSQPSPERACGELMALFACDLSPVAAGYLHYLGKRKSKLDPRACKRFLDTQEVPRYLLLLCH